ncbi:MAG: DUF1573 domain-containing protein [Bacteroidota bacterium]
MKRIILLFAFLIFCLTVQSQTKAIITFKKLSHDYGSIKAKIPEVKAVFDFKNTGNGPLLIQSVYPSCGCTSVIYPKTPVFPGEKGRITAVFHTKNIRGKFDKTILVYTNDSAHKIVILNIHGKIIQKGLYIDENYPQAIGKLSFKTNHVAFNKLKTTEIKTDSLWIFNSGAKKLKVEFMNSYPWLTFSKNKCKIRPGKKTFFIITYDASKRNDWGLNFDKLILKTNDDTLAEKNIFVSAEIQEDFSHLSTQQLLDGPLIKFYDINYEFGEVKAGVKIQHDFVFTNNGKTDLVIRKVKSNCECAIVSTDKNLLKPGESSKIRCLFNTEGLEGDQQKTITVISNDPLQSSILLSLIGQLNKD